MRLKLEGILPPHVTPFYQNEDMDENSLRPLIHFWLDSGCSGLVSCASNGEGPLMTREERRRVLEIAIEEVDGKAPVVAGTGATSTRETIALTRDAQQLGANAALIVTPYYFKPGNRELFEHYSSVISSTDIPIVLYNVPKFTGYNLDADVVVKLAEEHAQVVGVKDSGGSISQISELIDRVGNRISILSGTVDTALPCLLMGGSGGVIGVANVAPKLCAELYTFFKVNELEKARQAQMKLLHLNDLLVKKFDQISAIKEAMNQIGKTAGYPRRPSLPLNEDARALIRKELQTLGIH